MANSQPATVIRFPGSRHDGAQSMARRREAAALLEAAATPGLFEPAGGETIVLAASRSDLAAKLGVDRSTLWRHLNRCPAAGVQDGRLVLDTAVLEEIAAGPHGRAPGDGGGLEDPPPSAAPGDGGGLEDPPPSAAPGDAPGSWGGLLWRAAAELLMTAADAAADGDRNGAERRADLALRLLAQSASPPPEAGWPTCGPKAATDPVAVAIRDAAASDRGIAVAIRDASCNNFVAFRDAPVSNEVSEYLNTLTSTHSPQPRTKEKPALDSAPEAVPLDARGFPDDSAAGAEFARTATAEIARAAKSKQGRQVVFGAQAIEALAQWPAPWVTWACQELAGDIAAGNPIQNPAALLCAAARQGKIRYFPLENPNGSPPGENAAKASVFAEWIALANVATAEEAAGFAVERSRGDPTLFDALADACAAAGLDPDDVRAAARVARQAARKDPISEVAHD